MDAAQSIYDYIRVHVIFDIRKKLKAMEVWVYSVWSIYHYGLR